MAEKSLSEKPEESSGSDVQDRIDKYLRAPDGKADKKQTSKALKNVPLTLQPFFKKQIDLNKELLRRFPNMPLMSTLKFRDLYSDGTRGVATMSTQDGSASLIVDITRDKPDMQFAFTFGSMLSLRFYMEELSELDRRAWLDNMQTRIEDVVFLWGQSRWDNDYVICVPHTYYISMLAFSPNNFEAAVRVTPAVSEELFKWMHDFWYPDEMEPDEDETDDEGIFGSW